MPFANFWAQEIIPSIELVMTLRNTDRLQSVKTGFFVMVLAWSRHVYAEKVTGLWSPHARRLEGSGFRDGKKEGNDADAVEASGAGNKKPGLIWGKN